MKITLKNVEYTYDPDTSFASKALSDINLEIGSPGFCAVIGSTGSGKSTLIQLLNGLLKPTAGTILYDGRNIYEEDDHKKELRQIRCRVGEVFQYPENQLFESDVITDVSFGPKNLGFRKEEAAAKAEKALRDVNFPQSDYKKSPLELSGGQMRRAAIAGVLAMEPEILILDEPTAGLDPLGKTQILDKIKEIQENRNISVILVSHSMEEVAAYAERAVVLNKGQLLYDAPVKEVFSHYKELEKIGLRAPKARYFVEDLKAAGLDIDTDVINTEQAKEAILKALR